MLVYLALFAAAWVLRFKKPDVPRSFRIPFGNVGITLVCLLGIVASLGAIALGFIPPTQLSVGNIWLYESILIVGSILLIAPPIIIYLKRKPNWLQQNYLDPTNEN
jgi:amino acid transporter